jgi:hypothetical protein
MRKTFTAAALTAAALASTVGSAAAAPLPTGPDALRKLTGTILPAPSSSTGSSSEGDGGMLSLKDSNVVNLMSDHSRTQVSGTSGVQG